MGSLKFFPFQSSIEPGFWTALANKKLEDIKLSEVALPVTASFTHSNPAKAGISPLLTVQYNSLSETPTPPSWNQFTARGSIHLKNTIESFKNEDKSAFIKSNGMELWKIIESGEFWKNPSLLSNFAVIMYGDLKKFHFYYWFSFPSFNVPNSVSLSSCTRLSELYSDESLQHIAQKSVQFTKERTDSIFSFVSIDGNSVVFQDLSDAQNFKENSSRGFLCIFDPSSSPEYPGWPVRNLVVALAASNPGLLNQLEILCLRVTTKEGVYTCGHSLVLKLKFEGERLTEMPSVVGWEKNEKGQLGPRMVNMRSSMDPVKIAESSVDLNLKLMKWRLVPDLDLEHIKNTKFLLLGSGTLGCGVARSLLGWGVRNITFLDNSKVSYSNPVRQSLYEFSDCLNGGQNKAEAAAKKLRQIFPGVQTRGVDLSIPMPGHVISEATEEKVRAAHDTLRDLIIEHQVIFLLMDSRESRWLPTVMAACHPEKLVINAALGFDTYLVMRHGVRSTTDQPIPTVPGLLSGGSLGCYFCNDVVAPGDSLSDRTLDMQCTVTRPGASAVAAALAVELAVSCLQHPLAAAAPAPAPGTADETAAEAAESVLGIIPHTMRGSLHSFNQFLPTGPSFSQCTACSPSVLQLYKAEGFELVRKVGSSPRLLEDVTGLTELLNNQDIMDSVIGLDDDDNFSVSSSDI